MSDLRERDVILITLDSCRYDTAVHASTPNLDRLGPLHRAETAGTFTLPAHVAFFTGLTPALTEGKHILGGTPHDTVWRSAAARPSARRAAVPFTGRMLMDHYRRNGHRVLGAGGVTFFDPDEPANWLPGLFDEFRYFGRPNRTAVRSRIRDRADDLTLAHVDELADTCLAGGRFFLFLNCPSTHVPYTTPYSLLDDEKEKLLDRLYALHDSKAFAFDAFTSEELATLRQMQVYALQWADRQLGRLFDLVAHREPLVVVCADHGEEFGDGGRYGHGHPHSTVTTVPLWSGLLTPEDR